MWERLPPVGSVPEHRRLLRRGTAPALQNVAPGLPVREKNPGDRRTRLAVALPVLIPITKVADPGAPA